MKKLLMILTILLLVGCTPDENTAQDIQDWYDACNQIQSCSDKVDEMTEAGLSESAIIGQIQTMLANQEALLNEYGLTLDDHEARITSLEERVALLELQNKQVKQLPSGSATQTLLEQYGFEDIMWVWEEDNDIEVWINAEQLFLLDYTPQQVENALRPVLIEDLQTVSYPERITIVLIWTGGTEKRIPATDILK